MEHTQQMSSQRVGRMGWTQQEEALLWQQAAYSREKGLPLKCVFEQVAQQTGRKANSIRNYYYAQVRMKRAAGCEDSLPEVNAFVPFTQPEVRSMLATVLQAQAQGKSVRACTLEMGQGNDKAMLRYQNKYRSVVRNDPALVAEVVAELQAQGVPCVDPYAGQLRRRRLQPEGEMERLGVRAANALAAVAPRAATEVLRGLESLGKTLYNAQPLEAAPDQDNAALLREQCDLLQSMLRQLMQVNEDFLARNDAPGVEETLRQEICDIRDRLGAWEAV